MNAQMPAAGAAASQAPPPEPNNTLRTLAPFRQGKSRIAGHDSPIKLSANESPHGPSPLAIEAYKRCASVLYRYPDGSQAELCQAIAETFRLCVDNIVCGNGSDELQQLLIRAYVRPGDEVVFSQHSFAMAMVHATAQGARLVFAEEPDLRPDADSLLKAVTPKTRMVVLATPNNPVGRYISRDELWRLYRALPSHVVLLIDSAYADYVDAPDFEAGAALVEAGQNAVMTRTFSKLYGLAGLRIGWAYAPANIIDSIQRIRTPFNASIDAMAAAVAAVRDVAYSRHVRDYNRLQLTRIQQGVTTGPAGMEFVSSSANFYLLRFVDGVHTAAGAAAALETNGIIPRPVGDSGPQNCLRITVGLEHENDAVLRVLGAYMMS
ncbi:MAG: histidinol-phosphate transaminase [Gammaproteobacteria bacterium]